MHFTFSDTFFAGVEFSSVSRTVYRLGNLFCTIPFRKITFGVEKVGFFFSIGSIFCSFKIGIHHSCTYKIPKVEKCIHRIGGVD